MAFHVMLIPSMDCPSNCSYCWGVDKESELMDIEIIEETVKWLKDFQNEPVTFTFHGGEPLLAGYEFYKKALELLSQKLSNLNPAFAIQTNLWLMTPEIAKLFAEYNIPIGSSLDGPLEINDSQRGSGYFEKTMKGYKIAKEKGLNVSFISTFTSSSIAQKEAIFNFFLENNLDLKLHPALPSLRSEDPEEWAISPEEYGELLIYLLDQYLEHMGQIEIKNIDHLCKGVFVRRGVVCTYADCVGDTFAIGPDGNIYPCYRFVGMEEYVMGNVRDHPTMEDLSKSEALKSLRDWEKLVDDECADCSYIKFCRGGCPYNALTMDKESQKMEIKSVDHQCEAYKMIFKEITDRANKEFLSSPNLMMPGMQSSSENKRKSSIMDIMMKRS
ncbi:MAG: TIGR04083 family peptide-modifying radical SAM enzyme [Methanobacteriaceae archaeon]|nr:TIGR04083 family peptide-modifying radical SAM enzyme [Methanobacteriaceae archaeon]MDP2837512.1 TIGR04083 family peptide-modifying radical SAM enzyme [Methanobacteriaceae archaeon]MDP3034748.1 TIGR04083 family peptide-modifying radical SAM enzyme [Methanobacteriaceae archaeon]MDP3484122.1 TIGR04083 family peptide-modifying radical SAM enzyme [Methanobacteriaceae archaeon]MDP3623969.1 TIGR04083 family peptide-modifying radical SAM enzyme [Methanobacteriaceae archaeon]